MNNRVMAVERGEVDAMPFFDSLREVKRLSGDKNLVVTNKGYAGIGSLDWVAFNTGKKPFDDVRAVSYTHLLPICLFLFRSGNQSSKRGGDCLYQGPHVAWGIKKPGERFCSPGTRSVMVKRPTRRYQTAWKKGSSSARKRCV